MLHAYGVHQPGAYRSGAYPYGYTHHRQLIGHPAGGDVTLGSLGAILDGPRGSMVAVLHAGRALKGAQAFTAGDRAAAWGWASPCPGAICDWAPRSTCCAPVRRAGTTGRSGQRGGGRRIRRSCGRQRRRRNACVTASTGWRSTPTSTSGMVAIEMPATPELHPGIIGLGHAGLPLTVEFARQRVVVGFDISAERIEALRAGHDATLEVDDTESREAAGLRYTPDAADLAACNVYIVTVPTPIDAHKRPPTCARCRGPPGTWGEC